MSARTERDTLFIRRTYCIEARRRRAPRAVRGCGSNTSQIGRPAGRQRHPPCCYCETHTIALTAHPLIIFGTALSMCLPLRALLPDTIFDWVQKMSPRADPCLNAHCSCAHAPLFGTCFCDIDCRKPLFKVNKCSRSSFT